MKDKTGKKTKQKNTVAEQVMEEEKTKMEQNESLVSDQVRAAELKDADVKTEDVVLTTDAKIECMLESAHFIEAVAETVHEVNRAYCEAIGDVLGQYSWENAPQWMKESIIDGVKFHIANPDVTPEESHNNWITKKEEQGWSYGPVKDEASKKHPCFVPYRKLPVEQKAKDYIFKALVKVIVSIENR